MNVTVAADRVELRWESVKAWAETKTARSLIARPTSVEECLRVIEVARERGLTICPRGAGYSYADMILNDGHIVIDLCRLNRILRWDDDTGVMVVEPGVTFAQMLQRTLPSGWSVPACVGGMGVTVAGGISNNVHGKDAWKTGNFGDRVIEVKLLTATGQVITVNRDQDQALFRAVVGGMGLLGIIVEATLQLARVPSPFVEVTTTPVPNFPALFEAVEAAQTDSDFVIAWVDAFATGARLGRGFVVKARWIEGDTRLNGRSVAASLEAPSRVFGLLPPRLTWSVVRPFYGSTLVRGANAVRYYLAQWAGSQRTNSLFTDFNFMHKRIPDVKRVYQPYGLLEFQPLIPKAAGVQAVEHVFRYCQQQGAQSLLCGLKVHRDDDYWLSYAGDGYSFGIDIALRGRSRQAVERFARDLYSYVADQGGKAFLAKDELLPRHLFQRMYPRYRDFLEVKHRIDPDSVFVSDMGRRLLSM